MDPKKGPSIAIAILGKNKKPSEEEMSEGDEREDSAAEEADESIGLESAFAAVRAAIKSGDDKAGAEALKAFMEQC